MIDRRQQFRTSTCLAPGSATAMTGDDQAVPLNLLVLNMSGGGMLCQVNHELHLGTTIQVSLRVRDTQYLALQGRVVHVSPGPGRDTLIGCRFVNLSQADEDALMGFIFGLQAASLRVRWERQEVAS